MRLRGGSIFLIFILLLMSLTAATSVGFRKFDAMLAPLLLSLIIFCLAAIELFKERRKSKDAVEEKPDDRAEEEKGKKTEWGRCASALGWIGGFAAGVYIFGFYLGVPFFALSYMKRRGRSLPSSVFFSALLTLSIYLIFELGLKSRLYRGLIFNAL